MKGENKVLIGVAAALAVGAAAALLCRRAKRRDLRGVWSRGVHKLAGGKRDVVLAWSLPPGPPPDSTHVASNRRFFRRMCRTQGGKPAFYGPASRKWRRPPQHPIKWWDVGTCPGCSAQCARTCYAAKGKNYTDWQVTRIGWGNLCDVVQGKRLPEIDFDDCSSGKLRGRGVNRPCIHKSGDTTIYGDPDQWSTDTVVDSSRVKRVFVRIHVAGDMFDPQYAKQWLDHARRHLAKYHRAMAEYRAGRRLHPPPRIYYWSYTRSWRMPDPSQRPPKPGEVDRRRPHPAMLDILRTMPTLEYPDERDVNPEFRDRGRKQMMSVMLSADSDTGIPWMKDKRGRIMPVGFLLTRFDLNTRDPVTGQPAVFDWDKKLPGIIFRDHSLRESHISEMPEMGEGVFCSPEALSPERKAALRELAKKAKAAKAECRQVQHLRRNLLSQGEPVEDVTREAQALCSKAESLEAAAARTGCASCAKCYPWVARNNTDEAFRQALGALAHPMVSDTGEAIAEVGRAQRQAQDAAYERYKRTGPVFQMAVQPVATLLDKKPTGKMAWRIRKWYKLQRSRMPLLGEQS